MSEILSEKSFKTHKLQSLPIVDFYAHFSPKKAKMMNECGESLWFLLKQHRETNELKLKLENMYTCKDRFCPFCNWRRALKYSRLSYEFLLRLAKERSLRFIFLTLTVANPRIEDLRGTIKAMNDAYNMRLKRSKRWKRSILGDLKAVEVTVEKKRDGYVHPHFHVLLSVSPKFFKDQRYINHAEFRKMWRKALKLDYTPSVDIRAIKPRGTKDATAAVLAELIKYPMKDTDLHRLSPEQFEELTKQMKGLRMLSAGGVLKGILKDASKIDDDLIHIEDAEDRDWEVLERLLYCWANRDYALAKRISIIKPPDRR